MKLNTVISAFLLAFGVSYILSYAAAFIILFAFMPFASKEHIVGSAIDHNTPVNFVIYAIAATLQLLFTYLFFRIKRFKRGFPFLFKGYAIIVALIASGVILAITALGKIIAEADDTFALNFLLAGIFIIGIGIFFWIKRGIKAAYLRWAKDHNKELYRQEIERKDSEIRRLTELNGTLRSANHSIIHRLAAVERGYVFMLEKARGGIFSEAVAEEFSIALEDVRRVLRDYHRDVGRGKKVKFLPDTKVKMLDDLFGLFAERCEVNKIDFDLIVNGSIPYMVENVIEQGRLETMVGDHLQDALIAVDASGNSFRSIVVMLGLAGDHYELMIFDSGIPFEAGTLIRLGIEPVTARAGTGGSGEGFMKTFETMREYGASLVIDEKEPGGAGHSKSVTIRFDGKGQYVIETYRPGDFPPNDRYIVQ